MRLTHRRIPPNPTPPHGKPRRPAAARHRAHSPGFPENHPPRTTGKPRGLALVTVIMMVALMSFLIISVLLITSRHRQGAELYAAGLEVRQLSDITVNTVLGQLRQATTHPSDPRRSPAWISQPGAVRTWQGSSPDKLFKLYSSTAMTVDISSPAARSGLLAAEAATLAQWQPGDDAPVAIRARFTDLNQPVLKIDPDGAEQLHFPIADPRAALGPDPVEGFDFDPSAVAGTSRSGDNARLPMPVEWLYVLQDGSVGTLDPVTLRYTGEGAVSDSNPIVGRIAFWTDDESAKINVNTAAEGIPWDTPRADTTQERAYATQPPVANEVQRFPGHPATTSLSSVLFPGHYAGQVIPPGKQSLSSDQLRAIYDLAPRVSYTDANGSLAGFMGNNRRAVAFDDQRLYASFDEILFDTERRQNPISIDRLRRSRFFLTANSRAPEINVHGFPRVALWPVNHNADAASLAPNNNRSARDELIAFSSTIAVPDGRRYNETGSGNSGHYAGGAYHMLRAGPDSTHFTFYGAHNNTSDNSSYRPRRNYDLLEYLHELTRLPPPGHSRSLDEKYGLTEPFIGSRTVRKSNARAAIKNQFSFLRSVNLHDTTRLRPDRRVNPYTDRRHATGYIAGIHFTQAPGGPGSDGTSEIDFYLNTTTGGTLRLGPQLGPGRAPTVSEIAMILLCPAWRDHDGTFHGDPSFDDDDLLPNGHKAIQIVFLPEWFSPQQGYSMSHFRMRALLQQVDLRMNFTGGSSDVAINWSGGTALSRFNRVYQHEYDTDNPGANVHPERVLWGGTEGPELNFELHPGSVPRGFYLRTAEFFSVPLDTREIDMDRARIEMAVREGTHPDNWTNDNRLHQRIRAHWNSATLPVPNFDPELDNNSGWQRRVRLINRHASYGSATEPGLGLQTGAGSLIRNNDTDVVRSVTTAHGDHRITALHLHIGHHDRNSGFYGSHRLLTPLPEHRDSSRYLVHTLVGSGGNSQRFPGSRLPGLRGAGRAFIPGVDYPPHLQPNFPRLPHEAGYNDTVPASWLAHYSTDPAVTRDWDNGTGPAPDGAYMNKTDDGARLGSTPYFDPSVHDFGPEASDDEETSPPNLLLASAAAFGSIPSLPLSYVPWTTFLFRPDLTPGSPHFGTRDRGLSGPMPGAPADHLWLDLWWMPVVQPYAISEPFATAGKVNMNHQILPFTHITRATALHAVLKSEEIMAIPTTAGASYKTGAGSATWRHRIDPDETLKQWSERFESGDVFLAESEICELFLVPFGQNLNNMPQFWQNHALTGDNTLERPYHNLHPRLTTRSNVFRIHFKVQTIAKARSTAADTFDPGSDRVTGEFQGCTLVERYLEPRDPGIPDYADEIRRGSRLADLPGLDRFYRFRVLETRRFAP